eukprot:3170934-Alexandrium_andersonii.AAC.1
MNRLTEAAPESREHLAALSCKRLGPEGRSLPEHVFWRYTDEKCKPERRPAQGWAVQRLTV